MVQEFINIIFSVQDITLTTLANKQLVHGIGIS